MRVYTARQISNIFNSTRRPFPHPLCNPDVLGGNPCRILTAATSTTGRHGSGKTLISLEDLFSGRRTTQILQSDAQFINWSQSHRYQQQSAVVTCVKDRKCTVTVLETMYQVEDLDCGPSLRQGDQVNLITWTSPQGTTHLLG